MVAIFASTTTWLSEDFMAKIPLSILSLSIDNINAIPGVDCKQVKGDVKLTGQWNDLVTAHTLLEHCLDVNLVEEEDTKSELLDGETAINIKSSQVMSEAVSSLNQANSNSVTIKREIDDHDIPDNGPGERPSVTSKHGRRSTKIDYIDEDTEDVDYLSEFDIKVEDLKKTKKNKKPGRYACKDCNYVGKLENQLNNHIRRKHLRKFKCSECGKKYGYKADLSRHKSEVHSKKERFFCKICNKYLKTKGYIEDHMQLHNDNYVYHCKTCDKSFSTRIIFEKHIKINHPKLKHLIKEIEETLPLEGDSNEMPDHDQDSDNGNSDDSKPVRNTTESEIMMLNILSASDNDKVVHETDLFKVSTKRGRNRGRPRIKSTQDKKTEYACHLCDYIGKKECHLEYHIKRTHSQKLICDICDKQFGYNWDLKRHREQVHAKASFFCHICSKAYKVKKSFEEHLKSHEDGYTKSRFECTECEKSFSAKQVLENHIKFKHRGVQQKEKQRYLCQTCGQEFYHKYSYLSHMNKHMGLMPFKCEVCGKAFASEHSVREHQIVHKDIRNHCCTICAKTFKTSSALKAHEAIHSDSKDFTCGVCGKGFVQKQSLLRHERIHSGYKPYKCKLCDRPFTDSATVRKHMILVHKKDPHDWQGDVLSDLKRPREYFPEDWESDTANQMKDQKPKRIRSDSLPEQHSAPVEEEEDVKHSINDTQALPYSDTTQQHLQRSSSDVSSQYSANVPLMGVSNASVISPVGTMAPLSSGASVMQPLHNAQMPISSMPNTESHLNTNHIPTSQSAMVEMAANSILNLSSHLPPFNNPMNQLTSVHPMDSSMPSILDLSIMQNMNYSHHNNSS